MSKLALFYILLSTDATMMTSFNEAGVLEREAMLKNAGVSNASEVLNMSNHEMEELLSEELVAQTGSWVSLDRSSGNSDNKNNIGRIGLR